MPKNLIVCADGTGNKGGSTPSSNVYKIYKAVNKHHKGEEQENTEISEQIIFYDNGVGTEKGKYRRLIGGAFGFGFEDNVRDLYKFLARNYEKDDNIYFFGFSRGASTIRACSGFINTCGLAKGKGLRNRELDKLVKEAFDAYRVRLKMPEKALEIKESDKSHGAIDIHFMGIWDTVVALGFPKRTDITGPISAVLNVLFWLLEKGLDKIMPHSFYNFRLTGEVKNAYQALAIDDERTAFYPFVWREKGSTGKVEQVWFAGMHSNVGGGYARSGTASTPLHWMMLRAEECGLKFNDDAIQNAYKDSHDHGRIHNSRDGFAMMYRYHPREIEKLCEGRLKGNIRLHSSVIGRIMHRTANYAPAQLPGKFEVVESNIRAQPILWNPGNNPKWDKLRAEIDGWVLARKGLYAAMLAFFVSVGIAAIKLSDTPFPEKLEGFFGNLARFLDYILPEWFDGLIAYTVAVHYPILISTVVVIFIYLRARKWFHLKTVDACERLRRLIIQYQHEHTESLD